MEKKYYKYFDETRYEETLENGLRVIIFHKPEFSTSVCAFGTPYGALKINQKLNGKKYNFNPGIAHFLEHKLFESKGDDIMTAFSSMGANVNAFTSYRETVYYFSKTGEDIKDPLNLLLDFVQDMNISEKSVEKEKGIINQEISMYMQMPDQRLLHEAYKCMYHNYPIKYDIGGNKESIYAISKKELDTCYRINYHPSNMVLCITSPINPKKIIKIVKENQKKKDFKQADKPISNNLEEPIEVVKKKYSFKMPINTNKHLYGIKLKPQFKSIYEAFKAEWALRILFDCHFTSINPSYQEWLDKKIINDYFGYEIEFDLECAYILFYIENNDSNILINLINNSLKQKLLDEEKLEQIKRRYIGSMFSVFNDVEGFNNGFIRDYLSGLDLFDALECLKSITLKDVENVYSSISFEHSTYVSMIKK